MKDPLSGLPAISQIPALCRLSSVSRSLSSAPLGTRDQEQRYVLSPGLVPAGIASHASLVPRLESSCSLQVSWIWPPFVVLTAVNRWRVSSLLPILRRPIDKMAWETELPGSPWENSIVTTYT